MKTLRQILEHEPESLRYGPGAEKLYAGLTGKSLGELLLVGSHGNPGRLGLSDVRAATWSLLRRRYKRLTLKRVGKILDDFMAQRGHIQDLIDVVSVELLKRAMEGCKRGETIPPEMQRLENFIAQHGPVLMNAFIAGLEGRSRNA
jgi:hypothetical protein